MPRGNDHVNWTEGLRAGFDCTVWCLWPYRAIIRAPGRTEKCCLECSADLATAILLSTEIDDAMLAGRSTNAVSEFSEIGSRMLERSQSAELGNG